MTKKEENKSTEVQIDPRMFGYREGTKVEIEVNDVMNFLPLLYKVLAKETQVVYEDKETLEDTMKSGKSQVTELGVEAMMGINFINSFHAQNVENKVAVHRDVLVKEMEEKFQLQEEETKK